MPSSERPLEKPETIRDRMIRGERFHWAEVSSWIASQDNELSGAAFQALTATPPVIDGAIDQSEAESFLAEYCVRCMAGRDGASARIFELPPYLAANALATWYRRLRTEGALATHPTLVGVRAELKHLYLIGDPKQRQRVVNGTLEHIFESALCRSDFADWTEPELIAAVEAADEWAIDHQHSDPSPSGNEST